MTDNAGFLHICQESFDDALRRLEGVSRAWNLCRRANGTYEVEALFNGDDGWSRCGEYTTARLAFEAAFKMVTQPLPASV